jgi:hypothetical protein
MGEKYSDKGKLGSYAPTEEPRKAPKDVKFFGGYGADASDLDRGYIEPEVHNRPEYDKANYAYRSSQPNRAGAVDDSNAIYPSGDWDFQQKDSESKGFLTRPRIPTER